MLEGRLSPVGVYPDRPRASSSYGAADLSISAPISKGCCGERMNERGSVRGLAGES